MIISKSQAEQHVQRGFLIHLAVYVPVTAGLVALNFSRHPEKSWSLWVAGGWGLGVAMHYSLVNLIPQTREKIIERTAERLERRAVRRATRSVKQHLGL